MPKSLRYKDGAIIINVRSWWWTALVPWMRGVRGSCNGNIILLGPNAETHDLEHELVHIEQHRRYPFFFPLLYALETGRSPSENRFEREAYERAGNSYKSA